ncbi:MAG: DNA repair protein RadA, partial [Candidatus Eisenbacteria bacterium]
MRSSRPAIKPKKSARAFFCSACGNEEIQHFGRCPSCEAYGTMAEAPADAPSHGGPVPGGRDTAGGTSRRRWVADQAAAVPRPLADVDLGATARWATGMPEFDRVLGGGVVPGSLILVGGDPGIGKSTLMLQLSRALAGRGVRVLYVAGEESAAQVRLRAERLGPTPPELYLLCETEVEEVLAQVGPLRPQVVVVDSIQTAFVREATGAPGAVTQVRESAMRYLDLAKGGNVPVFLVGHVTKDGAVAGPRVLEHMVDAVLYLEGERYHDVRVLRAAKNRFGSTDELGVFTMAHDGLRQLDDASRAFLSEGPPRPGAVVTGVIEGTRALLVEVQALCAPASFAMPQRVTQGFDGRRLALLLAVLEKRAGVKVSGGDVFANVAGGLTLEEPGADLGVLLAVASSREDRLPVPGLLAFGEVGLSGEVRRVRQPAARVREAARLGFTTALVPAAQAAECAGHGLVIVPVSEVKDAL